MTSPGAEAAETVVSLLRQCEDKHRDRPLKHLKHSLAKTTNDMARKVKMVPPSPKFIPFTFYNQTMSHTAGLLCNSMNFKPKEKNHSSPRFRVTDHGDAWCFLEKCSKFC